MNLVDFRYALRACRQDLLLANVDVEVDEHVFEKSVPVRRYRTIDLRFLEEIDFLLERIVLLRNVSLWPDVLGDLELEAGFSVGQLGAECAQNSGNSICRGANFAPGLYRSTSAGGSGRNALRGRAIGARRQND